MANDVNTRPPRTPLVTDLVYGLTSDSVTEGKILISDILALSTAQNNTNSNEGTGAGLALAKDGVNLPLRSLVSEDGSVVITPTAEEMNLKALRVGIYKNEWIDAGAMVPRDTDGAIAGTSESLTFKVMNDYFEFPAGIDTHVQFKMSIDDPWDLDTIKVKFYWISGSVVGPVADVSWVIRSNALSDGDTIDAQIGLPVVTIDTYIDGVSLHISEASLPVAVMNDPVLGDQTYFEVMREGSSVADDYTESGRLRGVSIQYKEGTSEPTIW